MKHRVEMTLGMLILCTVLWLSCAQAMPPHPDLLARQQAAGTQSYFQQHESELRAHGVNEPTIVQRIRDMAGTRALDENFNMIAILVDFSDKVSQTAASSFDNLLYGTTTGTVNHYYTEVTYGNLTLVTVNLPSALGWRRAPQTYAYYCNGQNGFGTYPQNAQKLAEAAIALANPVVNFANYDNDDDNYVDALFIIHAGPGAEWTGSDDDIWSHKWQTFLPQYVDGVFCYVYSMEPEYWSSPGDMTCGVYAHEMGHAVFGLPDLYDYDYDSRGLGDWSLMAGGSWNGTRGNSPSHPDAWCRVEMGVATPTILTQNLFGASIPAIETTPTIYRLWTNGTVGNQFFLVENRRQTGYDAALPSQGLMIYHVDESQSGNNNQWYPGYTSNGHYKVALEQADGLWQLEQDANDGNSGDPYPGSTSRLIFDSTTTPDSRDYNGNNTQVMVRSISASAPTMTADLWVGVQPTIALAAPNGGEVLPTGSAYAIQWTSTNLSGNVKIELNRAYSGGAWETLFAATANDGSESWTVTGAATALARIRITSVSYPSVTDESDDDFSIIVPTLTVTTPNGGETWYTGESKTIYWLSEGVTGNVKIELNRTYPSGTWTTLFSSTANDGNQPWTVTGTVTATARIRITSIANSSVTDISNANFTITAPFISLLSPNGGEFWRTGEIHNVEWYSGGVTGNVKIELDRNYPSGVWETLFASTANDDSEPWTVNEPLSSHARIRISGTTVTTAVDTSNANFTIAGTPPGLFHNPLHDIIAGSGTITVLASSPPILTISAVRMLYRETGTMLFDSLDLTATANPYEYAAGLATLAEGTYEYYVKATDHLGLITAVPSSAPAELYSFAVGSLCASDIAYDDGTAERFNYAEDVDTMLFEWAVKFGPLPLPYLLCGVQFAAARTIPDTLHTPVHVRVYAANGVGNLPGTLLWERIVGSVGNEIGGLAEGLHWAPVIIRNESGEALPVAESEIYVSIANVESGKYEAFGRDTDGANAHRSYFYDPCENQWFSEDDAASANAYPGNRLIRLNGFALTPPDVTIYINDTDIELRWTDVGAPVYNIYSSASVEGPYEWVSSISGATSVSFYRVPSSVQVFYQVRAATE
ncbi:MAG: M6 family metalloprotease domain-containing protein [Calditrichota bacterium]